MQTVALLFDEGVLIGQGVDGLEASVDFVQQAVDLTQGCLKLVATLVHLAIAPAEDNTKVETRCTHLLTGGCYQVWPLTHFFPFL